MLHRQPKHSLLDKTADAKPLGTRPYPSLTYQRDQLELQLAKLRSQKEELHDEEYYPKLEILLRKLGAIFLGSK